MSKTKKDNNTTNIVPVRLRNHEYASKYINDDWGTIAFKIPRNEIKQKFEDDELRFNCIYFLIGLDEVTRKVYVGQAKKRNNGESVLARLREHDKSTTDWYCDIWTTAIVLTNKNGAWSLDDLNALEHAFYNEIPLEHSLNGNNPNSGGADYSTYTDKIKQVKDYIIALGYKIFTVDESAEDSENIQIMPEINDNAPVEDLQHGMARIPEIVTPHKVVKAMCDMLPPEIWNDQTVFLDPACKGGEYLREIYDRLMDCELLQAKYPNETARSNHILIHQIYGIALSNISKERTKSSLNEFDLNIRVIPNYIRKLKGIGLGSRPDGTSKTMQDILNEEFNRDMKIDVVIGNPPYQESNRGGARGIGGTTLYDKFINNAINVSDIICMVTKNNWFQSDILRPTRDLMIRAGIQEIINYPIIKELFKGVDVAVCIFCINKNLGNNTHYTQIENGRVTHEYKASLYELGHIPESLIELSIIRKTSSVETYGKNVLSNTPFGIRTNGRISGDYIIDDNDAETEKYNIPVLYMSGTYGYFRYTTIDYVERNVDIVPEYKIICGQQFNKNRTVLTNIKGLAPNQVCTSSYGVVYHSRDKEEAYYAYKYINSRLFRYLVYCAIETMSTISPSRFRLVPNQNFTSSSDLDWSQSISDIDQQLYKKYGLTQEEIDYIEKTIKPME